MWEKGWLQNDWGVDQATMPGGEGGREEQSEQVVEPGVKSAVQVCAAAGG